MAKDFSKTNFSSARAALGEAAKGDRLFQNLFADVCCTPVWEMAAEEHYLRGLLDTPKGLPGFYEAMDAWLQVIWIPPPQNVVDPVKAEQARALAIKNRTTTRARIAAEDGQDWEEQAQQQAREKKKAEAWASAPMPTRPWTRAAWKTTAGTRRRTRTKCLACPH